MYCALSAKGCDVSAFSRAKRTSLAKQTSRPKGTSRSAQAEHIVEKSHPLTRMAFFLAGAEGLDSRRCDAMPSIFRLCYAPRSVAALTCHRHVIHYRSPSSPSNSIPAKTEKGRRLATFFCFGRGRRTRTHDPWFWRPVLYQLSYTPVQRGILYHTSAKKAIGFSKKVSEFSDFFRTHVKIFPPLKSLA